MTFHPLPGTMVIGFGHKARQGKDTAATAILHEFPLARRFAFADDLYAIARVRHGMVEKDAPLLQRLGVDYRDQFGHDVWIRAVYSKLLDQAPPLALITDVRFPNELDFIRTLGGRTVRIVRELLNGKRFVDPFRDPFHTSETALDAATWDHTLTNHEGRPRLLETAAVDLAFDLLYPSTTV